MNRPLLASAFLLPLCGAAFLYVVLASAEEIRPSPDAKVTVTSARTEYLLGENVQINYVLENTGKKPFEAEFGGDYRGCDRALRFKVTATDENGVTCAEPDPNPPCFGGVGGPSTIQPGIPETEELALTRYRQFDHAGAYVITVRHDLGWKDGAKSAPTGTLTLHFRMPTPEEAASLVDHMESLPDNDTNGRGVEVADFRCFRYLVYLPPLLARAKTDDLRALEGLGSIPFPEATSALLDLAGSPDPKLALNAVHTLSLRLPDPEFTGKLGARGPFNLDGNAKRQALAKRSWDPKFASQVSALALKFLGRPDQEGVSAGAFLFQCVGSPGDAPAVFASLDRALQSTASPRHDPKDDVLDFPTAVTELLRAAQMLYARGYSDSDAPSGDAQFLAYFQHWQTEKPDRPADFANNVAKFGMASSYYPLRQLALQAIPQPMPDAYVECVQAGLADKDYGVKRVACDVAAKSRRKEFLKPILEIVRTDNEEWLMRSATGAALTLGGGVIALNACADRLTDKDLTDISLNALATVIDKVPGGWSGHSDLSPEELTALRDAWKAFLSKHETELSAGKKFKIGDPALTPALFGRARSYDLPGGKSWPPTVQ